MTHVPIQQPRKSATPECRLQFAREGLYPRGGRSDIDRRLWFVPTPGLPISARGTGYRRSGSGLLADHPDHDQDSRRRGGQTAVLCPSQWLEPGRHCGPRHFELPGQGRMAWLIAAGEVMTCTWNIALTACWLRNLSRSRPFWFRNGFAVLASRLS